MVNFNTPEQVVEIAKQYGEIIKKELNLRALYLYGSYVNGNYTSDSDIDIAVVAENLSGDRFEDTLKLMKYRRLVDLRIEPHPFLVSEFNEQNPLVKEIMGTGKRLM